MFRNVIWVVPICELSRQNVACSSPFSIVGGSQILLSAAVFERLPGGQADSDHPPRKSRFSSGTGLNPEPRNVRPNVPPFSYAVFGMISETVGADVTCNCPA